MEKKAATGRMGAYIRQPTGYRAFIPRKLPPTPPISIDDEMQAALSAADRALGRLDGSIQTLPDADLFVLMYVRKEAVLSSQIEGTQSSLADVLNAEAQVLTADQPKDVYEVLNYVKAMNHGLGRLKELPVCIRLVNEIHEVLLKGVRGHQSEPGELRRSQNWIGPAGCTLREATFVPPPPEAMKDALSEWESFLHSEVQMPLLLKIGLAHSQFETIHPFLDGNGRVGRLLITFLLCEKEVLLSPVLYLSYYFNAHRQRYYELLQNTRDSGDIESWLKFFLDGIIHVSREATNTARQVVTLREKHRSVIQEKFGRTAANALKVLQHLYSRPIISVHTIEELASITFPAANSLMERFVDQGILVETTGRSRNRRFEYSDYINLFSD